MSGSDRGRPGPDPGARGAPDLRLAPLAIGLWAAELAIVQVTAAASVPAAPAAGGLAVVGIALLAGRHLPRAVLMVAVGVGLGCLVGAAHLAHVHPAAVRAAVAEGTVVVASARITGDPRVTASGDDGGRPSGGTWYVAATVTDLQVRGRAVRLRVPVLLTGGAVEHLEHGARVRVAARARPPWQPVAHGASLAVVSTPEPLAPPGVVARTTNRIRADLREAVAGLPLDAGALLLGLAVGDESTLPADLDRAMVRAGLAHLTAVSGSNTSLVMALAMAVAAAAGLGWRSRVGASAVLLLGYVALVRPQPSVLRAAAMGAVALLALTAGGRRRGPPALLAAVIGLLLVVPSLAASVGFALSAAATAGLLVVAPRVARGLASWPASRWVPPPVRAALAVAVAAHVATTPLTVMMGAGASLVAIPANLVVEPAVAPATVLGLLAALLAPVAPGPAQLVAHCAAPFTGYVAVVARWAAATPGGVLAVPGGVASGVATAVVLLAVVLAARLWRRGMAAGVSQQGRVGHRRRRGRTLVPAMLLAAAVAAGLVVGSVRDARWPPPGWAVLVCDVGQGDALLLRAPPATTALLVDTGPAQADVVSCVRDAGVTGVVVLLSHLHADHVGGLPEVLRELAVTAVLVSGVAESTPAVTWLQRSAAERHVPVRAVRAGEQVAVAGMVLDILWPARALPESPENNASIVAVAHIPGQPRELRVLLTGDVEPEAQSAVLGASRAAQLGATPPGRGAAGADPVADVVKVPHHGSPHQVPGFVSWAGPRIALVSVGQGNDYGHPSPGTLADYQRAGAEVGRTDRDGALAVLPGPAPALVRQR